MRDGGQGDKIPQYMPEYQFQYLINEFWNAKGSDPDAPVDLSDTLLDRNERSIIKQMDRAFKIALADERRKNESRKK